MVAPLVGRISPIAGETLMSLIARACEANVFERPSQLIAAAGFVGDPRFVAFTGIEATQSLAQLLRLGEAEIALRMHGPVAGSIEPDLVAWFGSAIESRFVERRVRRVAPAALARSAHHRAEWTIKALSFCPETFQELITHCPSCDRELGWWKTEGLARCEHCRARLEGVDSPYLPENLRPSAAAAADLVSPDPAARRRAVDKLHDPFNEWSAAELFTAVVELGAAWESPGANRRSPEAKQLARGRLGAHSADVLASGWKMLVGWPSSLQELMSRVAQASAAADGPQQRRLRDVSLLGRHLEPRLPQTPFRRLVRERLGEAALAAKAPLSVRSAFKTVAQDDTLLTLTQAAKLSGVSATLLKRLHPDGESFAGGRAGAGGLMRFHKARLLSAARLMDDALTPAGAAVRLGIPEYCVRAFIDRELITLVGDSDVALMKGVAFTVSLKSLQRLHGRFEQLSGNPAYTPCRLSRLLAHSYSPTVWAAVFARLLYTGRGLHSIEDDAETPLSRRIQADVREVDACIRGVKRPRVPHRQTVTAEGAGLLLGIGLPDVLRLIKAGLLPAVRAEHSWILRVSDVRSFDGRWILSPEVDLRTFGVWRSYLKGFEPRLPVPRVRGWGRAAVESALGLSEALLEEEPSGRPVETVFFGTEKHPSGAPKINVGRLMEYSLEQVRDPSMLLRILSGEGPPES